MSIEDLKLPSFLDEAVLEESVQTLSNLIGPDLKTCWATPTFVKKDRLQTGETEVCQTRYPGRLRREETESAKIAPIVRLYHTSVKVAMGVLVLKD